MRNPKPIDPISSTGHVTTRWEKAWLLVLYTESFLTELDRTRKYSRDPVPGKAGAASNPRKNRSE